MITFKSIEYKLLLKVLRLKIKLKNNENMSLFICQEDIFLSKKRKEEKKKRLGKRKTENESILKAGH